MKWVILSLKVMRLVRKTWLSETHAVCYCFVCVVRWSSRWSVPWPSWILRSDWQDCNFLDLSSWPSCRWASHSSVFSQLGLPWLVRTADKLLKDAWWVLLTASSVRLDKFHLVLQTCEYSKQKGVNLHFPAVF